MELLYQPDRKGQTLVAELTKKIGKVDRLFYTLDEQIQRQASIDILYHFLANEYELLTLGNLALLKRKFIAGHNNKNDMRNAEILLKLVHAIPANSSVNSAFGNKKIIIHELLQHFPQNKSVALIKPISKYEISDDTLHTYSDIEDALIKNGCDTYTIFDFIGNQSYSSVVSQINYELMSNDIHSIDKKDAFIVIPFNYAKNNFGLNQLASFPRIIRNIVIALESIKKGGDLFIECSYFCHKPFIQLLYYLSSIFKQCKFVKGNLQNNYISSGYFIYRGYCGKNSLKSIAQKYYKLDKKWGETLDIRKNDEIYNTDGEFNYVFENILKDDIEKSFYNFIENIYEKMNEHMRRYCDRAEYVRDYLRKRGITKNTLEVFVNYQVSEGTAWCKQNGIEINEPFREKKPIKDSSKFHLFPRERGVDMRDLVTTHDSAYSVTKPEDAQIISQMAKEYFPEAKTIIDTCANIGGNTISFAKYFDNVIAIEIDDNTFSALKNNVHVYGRKNVSCVLGDYSKLVNTINGDLYFFDPPWSGIFYRLEKNLDMFLSGINVIELLPSKFIMKAPFNYNVVGLRSKFPNAIVRKIANYIVVINK